jgi:uncharacterized protein (TIGR03086 family)
MSTTDWRPLHEQALQLATRTIEQLGPGDLDRPTPCSGWQLADLLGHMIGQNRGFAAAITRPSDTTLADFAPHPLGADPLADWDDSVRRLAEAGTVAELARPVLLPEISTERRLQTWLVIGFHLLDTVVHGWDVAAALGRPYRPDAELTEATLGLARLVPNGPERLEAGAAFAPVLPEPDDDPWHLALTLLGRKPVSGERGQGPGQRF